MKFYFFPGACSMSCHIALEEAKMPFDLVYVGQKADEAVKKSFLNVNPLGMVPALELDDKKILTQNIAILEYIADKNPQAGLLEKPGTEERAETMRWLSMVAADLHTSFVPLFRMERISSDPEAQKHIKEWAYKNIDKYLTALDGRLQKSQFLSSSGFSIADCYLYTVYQWTKPVGFPTEKYAALNKYSAMIAERPSVKAVKERENPYR